VQAREGEGKVKHRPSITKAKCNIRRGEMTKGGCIVRSVRKLIKKKSRRAVIDDQSAKCNGSTTHSGAHI